MTRSRLTRLAPLALALGVALVLSLPSVAQTVGPPAALVADVQAAIDEAGPASGGSASLAHAAAATITEDAKLKASDPQAVDFFGFSVSLDGDRALVGSSGDDCAPGEDCGAAYVFAFDGTTWTEQQKLTASDANAGDLFGYSVSLDGDRALLGAYKDDCAISTTCGSAYVFTFDGTTWTEQQKLAASDAEGDALFGFSVSLSADRALVGAYKVDCADGLNCGAAYVYAFDGTSWAEEQKLTASDPGALDFFGGIVSLDGDRAVVASSQDDCAAGGPDCGAAYIFAFDGTTWAEQQKLVASDVAESDFFGFSMSLSGDRALIGSFSDDCAAGPDCGAAYIFSFDGTTWAETHKLTASDAGAGDHFGTFAALSGTRAVIGAFGDDCAAGPDCGAAYAFAFDGTSWNETEKLAASDGAAEDRFGYSVALDGDRAVVGAYLDDENLNSGSAYVFTIPNVAPVADAGPDQTVPADQTVTLDGSRSSDPDRDPLAYSWAEDGTEIASGETPHVELAPGTHEIVLTVTDGVVTSSDAVVVTVLPPVASAPGAVAPVFALSAPVPNPSTGRAAVAFSVDQAGDVRLSVYDALGRQVAVLADGPVAPGPHRALLDAARLPTGVYLVRLNTADGQTATQRMTVVR